MQKSKVCIFSKIKLRKTKGGVGLSLEISKVVESRELRYESSDKTRKLYAVVNHDAEESSTMAVAVEEER